MKIIEKVEIKHFRSCLGTPQRYIFEITDLAKLNVFSGANDSGKSNILRALNLFFNNEIASGIPFEFDRDFFIGKKDAGHKVIEVSIHFNLLEDKEYYYYFLREGRERKPAQQWYVSHHSIGRFSF